MGRASRRSASARMRAERQEIDAEAVLEARVRRAGPDAIAEAELLDPLQAHKFWRPNQVKLELP